MRTLRLGLISILLLFSGCVAAAGGGCFATCGLNDGLCKVERVSGKVVGDPTLRAGATKLLPDCADLKALQGPFDLQFRANGTHGVAQVPQGEEFRKKLGNKQLDCLIGDISDCGERVGKSYTGKRFGPDAPTEIAGQPCAMALPCGKVGLAADGSLTIRLGVPVDGMLTLFPSAGKGSTRAVAVTSSVARVPAGVLNAGETYRYRLVLGDGTQRAAGEFILLSTQAQRESDSALEEAVKARPNDRTQAAIESLLLDGREWEAFEQTLEVLK